jgi:uncharacterized protein
MPLKSVDGGDSIHALIVKKGAFTQNINEDKYSPLASAQDVKNLASNALPVENLKLVPYYYRANRGGRGQMRVGFKHGYLAV